MTNKFTPEEDRYLRDKYLTTPNRQLAINLNRSRSGIRSRMLFLGLSLPDHIKAERAAMSHFKSGQKPFNAGLKQSEYMSDNAINASKATRFKKGNMPHTCYNEVGKITIRNDKRGIPYNHICISIGKWVCLHRYLWSQKNGLIPPKHVVSFKDGDTLNCSINNLECITMSDAMLRNSGSINLPDGMVAAHLAKNSRQVNRELRAELMTNHKDLIQAKRTQLLIDRKIKQLQNGKEQNH